MTDHLVRVAGTDWGLWSWACVRGAGFSAAMLDDLAAPEMVHAVDQLLDAEAEEQRARAAALEALDAIVERSGRADDVIDEVRKIRKPIARNRLPPDGVLATAEVAQLRVKVARLEAAHAALPRVFETATRHVSLALRRLAGEVRLREAVTWQNRQALHTALESLVRKAVGEGSRRKERRHEELIASYIHRYAAKNDTIGFFGPIGWGRVVDDDVRIVARPGPTLLEHRETYLEQWGLDVIARQLSADPRVRPFLLPFRFGFVAVEEGAASSPISGRHDLSKAEAMVLAACDGQTTIRELGRALASQNPHLYPSTRAVEDALDSLLDKQLITTSLEVATTWRPDLHLRARVERIDEPSLRADCVRPLDALETARAAVSVAAGNSERVATALDSLDETFVAVTGQSATRSAGATYAARSLAFEDCRRNIDVHIGRRLIDEIGPALDLVLTSARYFTYAAGKLYEAAFRRLYDDIARSAGTPTIRFSELWYRAHRLLYGAHGRPLDEAIRDVGERWGTVLTPGADPRRWTYRSADLHETVHRAFAAKRPGWAAARYHSPDVMIAARGLDAIERGDYLAVLGEVHVAANTLDLAPAVAQHPSPDELVSLASRDIPEVRVRPVSSKDDVRMGFVRGARGIFTPSDHEMEVGVFASLLPRERVLRLAEMTVEAEQDRLIAKAPNGFRLDLVELMGSAVLGDLVMSALELVPEARHTPRITIDRLVVQRETWRFTPADVTFAFEDSELERFVAARRWVGKHGFPRFVFMRSSLEVKPVYVDFESPVAVDIAAKLIRNAKDHVSGTASLKFVEMLPSLEEVWLPDAEGNLYTSELRFVAVDKRR